MTLRDSPYGLVITPDLHGLSPGPHAAHVHEHPSCAPGGGAVPGGQDTYTDEPQYPPPPARALEGGGAPAGAAGGHYDPGRIDEHKGEWHHHGPYAGGHLGDLPDLIVEEDGSARIPVLAPRLTLDDVRGGLGHALVIQAGVDRYQPYADNEGAGDNAPVYCGIVK